ncbi:uroporphyrinogen-III C-methyltransferase [Alkalibacter mobilis]|uniref:uroporphyrinogen-III C-methyltransferase n=1 Tax=Alkalibacter mobilis TaxID=2787712 RepID=UPI00189E93EC|nr:uroporphyrinogen-III C-methyltransferase [Alkalibacter mobilis]MBF7097166.1 uroporphyrinogen-III C-methyltransferase [Alkalibacter mobilis]
MKKGKVYITGAGPGDEGLITVKGMESVKIADVIVYDRLAGGNLLKYAKEDCEFIYVGKQSSNHTKTQDEINEIIFQKAAEGRIVTRLKGGDPYVFGRGGEEGEYLRDRNIEFEVIPGITSAIGGLAYGGIPITHRDYASGFHVITGHLKEEDREHDWETLAKLQGTLVFLMGMAQLENITSNLKNNGMDSKTPVALINWATTCKQKTVTGTLETICDVARENKISSPVLIVVGKVVELKEKLNFFENRPLSGKRIMVTRARAQTSTLSKKIQDLGGEVIEFPMIKIKELDTDKKTKESIVNIESYDWMIFTSQNSVNIFFKKLFEEGYDLRKIGNVKIAAIGNATADELKKMHIKADLIPKNFVAESLFEELKVILKPSDRVLLPRGLSSREVLFESLYSICIVDEVKIYETIRDNEINNIKIQDLLSDDQIDCITFTSSSTVKNLAHILGENMDLLKKSKLYSIGPITSETLNEYGSFSYCQASSYDVDGLIEAICTDGGL